MSKEGVGGRHVTLSETDLVLEIRGSLGLYQPRSKSPMSVNITLPTAFFSPTQVLRVAVRGPRGPPPFYKTTIPRTKEGRKKDPRRVYSWYRQVFVIPPSRKKIKTKMKARRVSPPYKHPAANPSPIPPAKKNENSLERCMVTCWGTPNYTVLS